jgi:protein-tyrosine phosphatase
MIFDIHSHVILGVDDGAKDLTESLAILRSMKRQGVDAVLATPHFYAHETTIDSYVQRVSSRFSQLQQAAAGQDLPELFLGSEVYYFRGMSQEEDLSKLCIHGSRYIMIELPYRPLVARVVDEVNDIAMNMNLTPILAHCDRYLRFNRFEELTALFQYGDVKGQVNADSLYQGLGKKKALQFLQGEYCDYLGSDAHNLSTRPPNMDKALAAIQKKLGNEGLERIAAHADRLYQELKR